MKVFWKKGKAVLAVLLVLCIVFTAPDLMLSAETFGLQAETAADHGDAAGVSDRAEGLDRGDGNEAAGQADHDVTGQTDRVAGDVSGNPDPAASGMSGNPDQTAGDMPGNADRTAGNGADVAAEPGSQAGGNPDGTEQPDNGGTDEAEGLADDSKVSDMPASGELGGPDGTSADGTSAGQPDPDGIPADGASDDGTTSDPSGKGSTDSVKGLDAGQPASGTDRTDQSAGQKDANPVAGVFAELDDPEEPDSEEDQSEQEHYEMRVVIEPAKTSVDPWSFFSARAAGSVQLAAGNHEKWIDRIVIPDYAKELYAYMAEASDNDGVNDDFIDDSFLQGVQEKVLFVQHCDTRDDVNAEFSVVSEYVRAVFDAFDRDYPEVFWLTGISAVSCSMSGSETYGWDATFTLDLSGIRKQGYSSAERIKNDISVRESQIRVICAAVADQDTVGKIRGFNDWLTKNNEYNTLVSGGTGNPEMSHECLGALKGSTGVDGPVCEGYARAFKILCDRERIPCVLVDGLGTGADGSGEAHMWNNVQVNGVWYAADVTWNDPVVKNVTGAVSGYENQNWLLAGSDTPVGSQTFGSAHTVQNKASDSGPAFTNGPVLSTEKYVPKAAATVAFASAKETVSYSGKEAVITAPVVTVDGTPVSSPVVIYSYRSSGISGAFTEGLPTDAGTYEVKAAVAAGADYAGAESADSLTLVISRAPLTVTALDQTVGYGDVFDGVLSDVTLKCEGLKGNDVLASCNLSVPGGYADAGTYTIRADGVQISRGSGSTRDVTGNYEILYVEGTLTVTQAVLTDRTNREQNIVRGYGTFEEPSFTDKKGRTVSGRISYEYDGTVYTDYADLTDRLGMEAAGVTGTVSYRFTPDSANYETPAPGTIHFTVADIAFTVNGTTVTAENAVTLVRTPVYGDTWEDVLSVKSGLAAGFQGQQDSDPSHFTLSVSGPVQAGEVSYSVIYSGTVAGSAFRNVVVCRGSVTVEKAPLTITVGDQNITYGETVSNPEVTYEGFRNGDDAAVLSGSLNFSYSNYRGDAGEYAVTADGLTGSNYDITVKPGCLTVAKRVIDLEWQGTDPVTYDGTEHEVTAVPVAGSVINNDDVRITYTGNKGTSAGTYTAAAAAGNANYAVSGATEKVTFVIAPRVLAFTWSGEFDAIYDGGRHGIQAAVDENSLVSGDRVTVTCTGNEGVNAGNYTARVSAVDSPDYTVSGSASATMEWSIGRRGLTDVNTAVTLDETELVYNAAEQTRKVLSVMVTVGMEKKELAAGTEYTTAGDTQISAGDYILTVTGIGNYTGSLTFRYRIEKADEPQNRPQEGETEVLTRAGDLSQVSLPEEWVWEDPDVALVPGGTVTVWAVIGNRDNYNIPENDDSAFRVKYEVSKLPELVTAATDETYTVGAGTGAVIRSTGALSEFRRVEVDGKAVDPSDYTLQEGSTILTFKSAYLDTLSAAEHRVQLFYTVGSVSANLTVMEKTQNPSAAVTPAPAGGPGGTAVTGTTDRALRSPKTGE